MTRTRPRRRHEEGRADRHYQNGRTTQPTSSLPQRPPSPRNSYRPGGQNGSDSWRPGDNRRADPYRPRDYDNGDSYRPRPPQGDFTFRVDKPSGISSHPPPPSQPSSRNDKFGDRRNRRGGRGRGGRTWQPPPHPSERALLSKAMGNLPEERLHDDDGIAKFRDLDEISDDDELEMDISSQSESEQPSKKRVKTTDTPAESGSAAPKWSNPDPYTALPCPDESQVKKRDVVALIRKARVEESSAKSKSTTEAENFIAFDSSSDDEAPVSASAPPPPPPLPPKEPPPPLPANLPPLPPGPPPGVHGTIPTGPAAARDHSGPLGSRKRTADDEIKPPNYQLKKGKMKPAKGLVVPAWQPKAKEEPCPWVHTDHSATLAPPLRLHKEIMDFYHYVKPRDFEQRIRETLVDNLRTAMTRDGRNFRTAEVYPFGSFSSGLYLPTADMDLVVCSRSYADGGAPTFLGVKSWLYKFQKMLISQRVAEQDSIEVIAFARIPLVKFVDRATGLKVDVSFDNLGGVGAIQTFLEWKRRYPAMPILVTIIKHFLLMRGLNEPVNGGIGGFSVICLVVSMLQVSPQVQSRSQKPEHHLGELLLEFLDLYGNTFEYQHHAISLKGKIGYIRKSQVRGFSYKNSDRLSIIDPNNEANDISGGSSNTSLILARFRLAHTALTTRMEELAKSGRAGSILEVILEGDYSSFRDQRAYLKHVHEKTIGPCHDY